MSNTTNQAAEEQITPREVILKVIDAKNALVKSWKVIVLFIVLGVGIGYAMDLYLIKPNSYEATIVFNMGGSAPGSDMGNLAGLFGMSGATDANIFTGENFFYFVKSRPVLERALMKEIDVRGKKILMANFFIDSCGIKEDEWKGRPELHNFKFTERDPDSLKSQSRVVLNELVLKVKGVTEIGTLERKSSFISLTTTIQNESLAALWAKTLLKTVEEVYTEKQTRKSLTTLKLLERRADSLAFILGKSEHRLAKEMDYSTQLIVPEAKISVNKLERNNTFLQQLYYEAIGNAEKMRVSLVREAPLFTLIEDVKIPLDLKSESKKRAKIGALVGLMLALIYVYVKSIYRAILDDTKQLPTKA
ncbi:hypothetical protein [Dyadobacter sp. LHD-138]|uniref:hypothetical protein n=1 Tax=Dyadobacter sp. LHD-138 TaxID=3071413 RepID=UPI0027E1CD7D|nr:hypothetical protein [Dyadobacter sp. LHD-138]MDQ6477306.1 hypothetical protein [Dyadobacter sp. LHD-138]